MLKHCLLGHLLQNGLAWSGVWQYDSQSLLVLGKLMFFILTGKLLTPQRDQLCVAQTCA